MEKISINISDEVQGSNAVFETLEEACKYLIDLICQRAKNNVVVNRAENQVAGSEE